jgi:hypothetical protein
MIPLVYVHGAGPQPPADDLGKTFGDALFPGSRPPVTVAYFADICWPPPSADVAAASAGSRGRAAVQDLSSVIAATSAPGVTREAVARAILAAADGRLPAESVVTSDRVLSSRRRRRVADPRAVELMEVFLEGADQAARAARPASAAGQPRPVAGADLVAGVELLEPILRTVAGGAGRT